MALIETKDFGRTLNQHTLKNFHIITMISIEKGAYKTLKNGKRNELILLPRQGKLNKPDLFFVLKLYFQSS